MQIENIMSYIYDSLLIYIQSKKSDSKQNLSNKSIYGESFFIKLLNILFDYQLNNSNDKRSNFPAFDAIDDHNKIVVQISSQVSLNKINKALSNSVCEKYSGYHFIYLCIETGTNRKSSKWKATNVQNPYNLIFNLESDFWDVDLLFTKIRNSNYERIEKIAKLIEQELGYSKAPILYPETDQLNKILSDAVKQLLSIDLEVDAKKYEFNSKEFSIKKKIEYNNLSESSIAIINNYKVYCWTLDKVYKNFETTKINTTFHILNFVNKLYVDEIRTQDNPDSIFHNVIRKITEKINLNQYDSIMKEQAASIIVVHAFIECKIFKHPGENK